MNSFEKFGVMEQNNEQTEGKALTERVNALMKDFPSLNSASEEEVRNAEDILDAEMEKMSQEELIDLAEEIREYLNRPQSGFVDENMYLRFGTVYGAACMQLEKLENEG